MSGDTRLDRSGQGPGRRARADRLPGSSAFFPAAHETRGPPHVRGSGRQRDWRSPVYWTSEEGRTAEEGGTDEEEERGGKGGVARRGQRDPAGSSSCPDASGDRNPDTMSRDGARIRPGLGESPECRAVSPPRSFGGRSEMELNSTLASPDQLRSDTLPDTVELRARDHGLERRTPRS